MASRYVDNTALVQVIGNVFNNPSLLENTDTFVITEEDFPDDFHKIVFGSIYNLYFSGTENINITTITDYLDNRPKKKAIFEVNKGAEYLMRVSKVANKLTLPYYYARMKKMTLLRAYDNIGFNVSQYYDPDNIADAKKKELQEEWLDKSTLVDIANIIEAQFTEVRNSIVEVNEFAQSYQAGEGAKALIERFEQAPDIGVPLYGSYINTITRGARLGKFYLRSGATGVGKSRSLIADACYIGCSRIYDEQFGWIKSGSGRPTLYIGTEQDLDEIQSMMMAFISNVPEDHILNGRYEAGERDRVLEAAKIMEESPLYIEIIPDFNLEDIETIIKKAIREHDIHYVMYDYIHTSLKILAEISQQTGKITLREDNILFMLSSRLKELCVKYNIFIMSATQLSGDIKNEPVPDQGLLRGAKSIADKIDYGSILLNVTEKDVASLENILAANPSWGTPNVKLSIYKNRRGRYKGCLLWGNADLGTCRVHNLFLTNYQYELIPIEDLQITLKEEQGAFDTYG